VLEEGTVGLVEQVRAVEAPFDVLVGGYPAQLADYQASMLGQLPVALVLVLAVTFVILFLMTGSVVLPAKATALNILSISVMLGILVWGFQDGNLAGLLGFTVTGALEPSIPILMLCVAYGLSMDYEVFMMSRIKEEHDAGADTTAATAAGLQRSGPLITAAGLVLAASFAAYATSGVLWLQMVGVGLAAAILIDVTLVRALLMPAAMRLAGPANWWAPPPLRRLHARIGMNG
jgi:putative drug exporter of the RND superfamily